MRTLCDVWVHRGPASILIPTHAGRRGHPAMIGWRHVTEIQCTAGRRGDRRVFASKGRRNAEGVSDRRRRHCGRRYAGGLSASGRRFFDLGSRNRHRHFVRRSFHFAAALGFTHQVYGCRSALPRLIAERRHDGRDVAGHGNSGTAAEGRLLVLPARTFDHYFGKPNARRPAFDVVIDADDHGRALSLRRRVRQVDRLAPSWPRSGRPRTRRTPAGRRRRLPRTPTTTSARPERRLGSGS